MVAVTVLGTVDGGPAPGVAGGALAGDVVLVTGPCGGSAAGLRELRAGDRPTGRRWPAPTGGPWRGCARARPPAAAGPTP